MTTHIRPLSTEHYPTVLSLNTQVVTHTSHMDEARLRELHEISDYCTVAITGKELAGFLIVLRETAPYENDNHAWFRERIPRFLYVDRIAVDARSTGRGIGRQLYQGLFDYALEKDVPLITCEYNLQPPNPVSAAFHQSFGFEETGRQWSEDGKKQVSMQQALTSLNTER